MARETMHMHLGGRGSLLLRTRRALLCWSFGTESCGSTTLVYTGGIFGVCMDQGRTSTEAALCAVGADLELVFWRGECIPVEYRHHYRSVAHCLQAILITSRRLSPLPSTALLHGQRQRPPILKIIRGECGLISQHWKVGWLQLLFVRWNLELVAELP